MITQTRCPLCKATNHSKFSEGENRLYLHCKTCDLVFVPSSYYLCKKDEKAKYDNHQNSPSNEGYRTFLNRLLVPLQKRLDTNAKGLDFGSGPGPTLSVIMQESGYSMDIYDYFYHPDQSVFENYYDFITTTEVIEHLHHPYNEISKLWECLKSDGYLGIMTAFRPDNQSFHSWYYKRDLTHISFFTQKTFQWLATTLDATLEIPQDGVIILKKRSV
ncbi:MAG: class I SAM-dependent methyltransferase [Epsilonproteobacteria bacterium]|nr:class I SAM-dependent methyltransferase [Campylobacterota bacterium]